MDKLDSCIEALRHLARQADRSQADQSNACYSGEKEIGKYLQTERDTLRTSLDRLATAIDSEAVIFPGDNTFWITMREFVQTRLPDDTEDWEKG
jgi:hypothetical protein